jgi:hypothetical protein
LEIFAVVISLSAVGRFINWQAAAIYEADPQALVTAGSSAQVTNTDNFGKFNFYKDECLVKAGNKSTVSVFFWFWLSLYAHRHRSILGAASHIILTPVNQLMEE